MSSDVLVVGGGPAGATAARRLARAGARVRLIDRARFPRNKPCGGAISARALSRFPYIAPALDRISTHWISRLRLESPGGETSTLESDSPAALMIRRVEFDQLLLSLAIESGVDVIDAEIAQASETQDRVTLRDRDGRTFRAPHVIACDGVNSVVARRLGLNDGWPRASVALDMMEETSSDALAAADPGLLWVSYGYDGSEGYAYVFPKRDHVNVGVGFLLSFYRDRVDAHPSAVHGGLISQLTRRGVLAGKSVHRNFTPFLIPVGGPLTRTATSRVLLAGDAGGFVNGFTAEGIYYAMVTGELAADALSRGRPLDYPRAWRAEIGAELRDSVLVQRFLFAAGGRVDAMVRGATLRRDLADGLVSYAMGRIPYRAARRRLMRRLPGVAISLALHHFARRAHSWSPYPGRA
jgi:geranylgeranyl reductase family protein